MGRAAAGSGSRPLTGIRPPGSPDWLILGQELWDEMERRNQLLVRAVARRHPRARFLFVEIPFRPRELRSWTPPRVRQQETNIWAVRPVRPLPERHRALADRAEAAQIRGAMKRVGLHQPLLWTQDSRSGDLVDHLPVGSIVFDLTDDWAAFERTDAARDAMRRRIEAFGRRADKVFACSRQLEATARAWAPDVTYLPNAVEPPVASGGIPADLDALPRPRLGYVGTLHSSRLDAKLLAGAAALRPSWSFALIGPDMLEDADRAALAELPNVVFLGSRPHAAVASYIAGLDACLISHVVDDFTKSLDPLKLYEYLAAGKPVISTPVGNAEHLSAVVRLADSPEGLVTQADEAMAQDGAEASAERRRLMAGETWDARAAALEAELGWRPEPTGRPGVTVAVVSFNTRELLRRCLTQLRESVGVDLHVVVVDNASSDGSADMVRQEFAEFERIESDENAGFARANNLAFERCSTEYFLLLNSDAFVEPTSIARLVEVAEATPSAAAVGPQLRNADGSLQRSAWPFPTASRLLVEALGVHRLLRGVNVIEDLGVWAHDEQRMVDFLVGACLLMRSTAYAEVGGFDEGFQLYAEEADLQKRLNDRGWSTLFTPSTRVTHVGGGSSSVERTRIEHFYVGQRRYLRKHGSVAAWPIARLALGIGSLVRGRWTTLAYAVGIDPSRSAGRDN